MTHAHPLPLKKNNSAPPAPPAPLSTPADPPPLAVGEWKRWPLWRSEAVRRWLDITGLPDSIKSAFWATPPSWPADTPTEPPEGLGSDAWTRIRHLCQRADSVAHLGLLHAFPAPGVVITAPTDTPEHEMAANAIARCLVAHGALGAKKIRCLNLAAEHHFRALWADAPGDKWKDTLRDHRAGLQQELSALSSADIVYLHGVETLAHAGTHDHLATRLRLTLDALEARGGRWIGFSRLSDRSSAKSLQSVLQINLQHGRASELLFFSL